VLHAWAELSRNGPPGELTTIGRLLQLPPLEEIPEPVRGKSFAIVEVVNCGDPADPRPERAALASAGGEFALYGSRARTPLRAEAEPRSGRHLSVEPPGPAGGGRLTNP
jgi:hypothetical protein